MVYDGADGYVLFFGGDRYAINGSNYSWPWQRNIGCMNDTWVFDHGMWTNLSIASPPAACYPAMAYDSARHVVVAYISAANETWTFAHGKWTRVSVPEPDSPVTIRGQYWVDPGALVSYVPAYGAVLLFEDHWNNVTNIWDVEETWEFNSTGWCRLTSVSVPFLGYLNFGHLAYDLTGGSSFLLAFNGSYADTPNVHYEAWTFSKGQFTDEGALPEGMTPIGPPVSSMPTIVGDPRDGYVLAFSSPYMEENYHRVLGNYTWTYSAGLWTNESIPGPPGRIAPSMVFDAADGYVLLFGGVGGGDTPVLMSDTWIYAGSPLAAKLTIVAAPLRVCSLESENCGVGTDEARVNLTVEVLPAPTISTGWIDTGNGVVEYGSEYSFLSPKITFVGRGDLVPAPNLEPMVECTTGGGNPTSCNATPVFGQNDGLASLQWNWSGAGSPFDALWQGDEWQVSFNVLAKGPPFTVVPIDTCDTTLCFQNGAGVDLGPFTSFSFDASTYTSGVVDSFPLARVSVLPPLIRSPPSVTSSPPPSPPPPGTPLPVSLPVPTAPVPLPVLAPVVGVAVATGVSFSAVAAGIIGAGAARATISYRAQRVALASRVSARSRGSRPPGGVD